MVFRMCFNNVVFPDPRNPERTVTGNFLFFRISFALSSDMIALTGAKPLGRRILLLWFFILFDADMMLMMPKAVSNSSEIVGY